MGDSGQRFREQYATDPGADGALGRSPRTKTCGGPIAGHSADSFSFADAYLPESDQYLFSENDLGDSPAKQRGPRGRCCICEERYRSGSRHVRYREDSLADEQPRRSGCACARLPDKTRSCLRNRFSRSSASPTNSGNSEDLDTPTTLSSRSIRIRLLVSMSKGLSKR